VVLTTPVTTGGGWRPRRIALFALAMMVAGYVTVFVADGATPSASVLRNALANTAAAVMLAPPVWWLSRRLPWAQSHRWWFLPSHVLGAALFTWAWYVTIAYALGLASWTSGGAFRPSFLQGAALHWEAMTAVVLYCAIAAGCYVTRAAQDADDARALQHQAEMRALRAQLDPHLLFNTLHTLLELVRSGDARAEEAIDRFARVARYVSQGRPPDRDLVSLGEEWGMCVDYAALEMLRLGPRLTCRFEIDDGVEQTRLPALTVQPLLENAIRHGIAARPGPGVIEVTAVRRGGTIHLEVCDDGLGAAATTSGAGTGLDLVRRRLLTHFGAAASFDAGPRHDGTGWRVAAAFPAGAHS
jgi:signal transduction histidine kinase